MREAKSCGKIGELFALIAGIILFHQPGRAQTPDAALFNQQMPVYPQATNYVVERIPGMPPMWPVGITTPPGETNRLFFVYQPGGIGVVPDLKAPAVGLFLDLRDRMPIYNVESGVLGLAFHPNYKTNGWFFVFYTANVIGGDGNSHLEDRLSRFQVDKDNPNHASTNSEVILISQPDEDPSHNAGDLHFGPDGYLYVSLGDEGLGYNQFWNAGRIDKDFFSAIMRLDVDGRKDSLAPNPHPASRPGTYWIPADNPFIGATNYVRGTTYPEAFPPLDPASIRTEFYAIGFRNPWRFSIDARTGDIYVSDVGQENREEIDLIRPGAHYGWPFLEGTLPTGWGDWEGELTGPLWEYPHQDAHIAVTGSLFYRGNVYPELDGSYVFADLSGSVGVLRQTNSVASAGWIGYYSGSIYSLGIYPPTGEIAVNDGISGYVGVLKRRVTGGPVMPQKLSATGIFKNLSTLEPQTNVVPYDVNVSFWSDNAIKQRWFSRPSNGATIGFAENGYWTFPEGMMWVKHFDIELEPGNPASAKRLETRVLIKQTNGVYGVTYKWDQAGQDATLVPAGGLDEDLQISENGTKRTQRWHYPARFECQTCHTPIAGYALGFNTPQLNKEVPAGNGIENQLAALGRAGHFTRAPAIINPLPRLAALNDERWSVGYRARSYLAANCSQCHQPNGPTRATWDARITTPLSEANIINGPLLNYFGTNLSRVVVPGDVDHSILHRRLVDLESYHMPPLGTSVLNTEALSLIEQWIGEKLAGWQSYADWQAEHFDDPSDPLADPDADPDLDGLSNETEYLLGTAPDDPSPEWHVSYEVQGDSLHISFPRRANARFDVQWTTNILDSFSWQSLDIPENQPLVTEGESLGEMSVPVEGAAKFFRVVVSEP